ncbi:MAG: LytTR family DNA-binding domain-containing protein [Nevskia sp.]|nr:LytTR family DNA-binding domain-containing protein [Nevskia sp.]
MAPIRTLIVDDMPPARRRIRRQLERAADFEVVGECGDGASAIGSIKSLRPDLVFLDVQMPEVDGFGVVAALEPENRPAILFVTAHDEHALRAFEVHALDYLLKPFDVERFDHALQRARDQLRLRDQSIDQRLDALLAQLRPESRWLRRVAVKTRGRTRVVAVDDIDWIGAEGNYLSLHAGGEAHLIRETMSAFERQLDPERFVRIHRSTIVNLDRVRELTPLFNADHSVLLKDGTELTLSRSYHDKLKALLGDI